MSKQLLNRRDLRSAVGQRGRESVPQSVPTNVAQADPLTQTVESPARRVVCDWPLLFIDEHRPATKFLTFEHLADAIDEGNAALPVVLGRADHAGRLRVPDVNPLQAG